jgi:CelD/BcsL family acetyltransferase involved in cellulose biosynthesis
METVSLVSEPAAYPGDRTASDKLPLKVELVTDYPAFVQLGPVWNRLVEESGVDHPFMRHEWVCTWWDSFKPEGRLYIIVVKEGQKTVALAPLMLDRGRIYGCPVRRLRGIANIYTERFDFILGDRPEDACRAIWKFLAQQASNWDMLELRQVPAGAQVTDHLLRDAFQDKFLLGQWHSTDGPYIPITQPWDAYLKSLSKKHVSNLRGRAKGLHRLGPVHCEIVTGGEGLERTIQEAFMLEAAAWKGQAGTAILNGPERLVFYRRLLTLAAEQGWLRLHFLTLDGKRIAVQIALLFHNKLYILKSGYDPHYAAFAPSLILCEMMLREAWNHHFSEVDFLGSSERWKLEWAKEARPHSWLFVFPNRPRTRLLHRLKFTLVPRLQNHAAYRLLRMGGTRLGLKVHDE